MEDNRPTLAQYFVEQVCPDNKYVGLERVKAKFNSLVIAYNLSRLGFLLRNQGITA